MSNSFPREKVLEELRALREATQALHRRLEILIGDIDGEPASDPRIVEIARRAIAELREKQRGRSSAFAAPRGAAPSKSDERRAPLRSTPRRQP